MASKVLVKIPVAPFGHMNKGKANDVTAAAGGGELVSVGRAAAAGAGGGGGNMEGPVSTSKCTDPLLRIAQLEQNIRFLQEQHQAMLAGLHQEIDSLRQRNRDLQFQLVFTKGSIVSSSSASPSSPEENVKVRVLSPKQVNVTPLQVELLERELGELKVSLQEVNTRNVYLTSIIDEQKKTLERQTDEQQQQQQVTIGTASDPELLTKLDDVESLVRKLRRENDELRREVTDIRSTANSGGGGGNPRHRGNNHHYRGHRFPPLSYWHGKGSGSDTNNTTPQGAGGGGGGLPTLHNMNQAPLQPPSSSQQGHHYSGGGSRRHHHHHHNNNNHHQQQQQQQQQQQGEHRKYRGGGGGQARSNNKP